MHCGTGIRGLMRGMATFIQGNQELLVIGHKVGRSPHELGVSKYPSLTSLSLLLNGTDEAGLLLAHGNNFGSMVKVVSE